MIYIAKIGLFCTQLNVDENLNMYTACLMSRLLWAISRGVGLCIHLAALQVDICEAMVHFILIYLVGTDQDDASL